MYQRVILVNRVPMPKPPAALEDRAQEAARRARIQPARRSITRPDSGCDYDYARYIDADVNCARSMGLLRSVRPGAFFLWYRTSPQVRSCRGAH